VDKEAFKFPDEKEPDDDKVDFAIEGEADVEVVDDTPEPDRGRKPMTEPPKEFADDELAKYDESVRKRIQHFTKGYHEERRAKEAALREREEALKVAQAIVEENKKLKGSLGQNQAFAIDNMKKLAANELEAAKKQYKEAYEAGDADALVDAQEAITTAKLKAERANNFKPPVQEEKSSVKDELTTPVAAPPDYRAQEWQRKNTWFGNDEEMTSFALGLHTKLVNSGVDPKSDEYYDRLNSRLRQVFPESFEAEKPVDAPPPRSKSNVAPATRSTAPKKIVLTQTQVNIAKKLGVPLELYARKVAEELRK
jgi:hypothetical protein